MDYLDRHSELHCREMDGIMAEFKVLRQATIEKFSGD